MEANTLHIVTAQWVLPLNQAPIEQGFMAIADGKIIALGPLADLPSDWRAKRPESGTLLTPGLINAHVHLEQSFPAPIPKLPDEPFCDWLLKVVALTQRENDPAAKRARAFQGTRELLATGTTCVNDIASGPESFHALDTLGLRGLVSLEVFHPAFEPVSISHWVNRFQELQGIFTGQGRLRLGLSPHSPYNVSPAAWEALVEACCSIRVHAHLAEFVDEALYLQGEPSCIPILHQTILGKTFAPQQTADSAVRYLARFGLLNDSLVVAHAVETDATDRQRLAEAGVSVAHCPRSNLTLHGRTLKASECAEAGIPLALGTDGRLSTEDLDLRAEARCAMARHGWSAAEALAAITLHGAKALGLEGQIGVLSPGYEADYVLWQAPQAVASQPEVAVLDEATQVSQVVIQGQTRWVREDVCLRA